MERINTSLAAVLLQELSAPKIFMGIHVKDEKEFWQIQIILDNLNLPVFFQKSNTIAIDKESEKNIFGRETEVILLPRIFERNDVVPSLPITDGFVVREWNKMKDDETNFKVISESYPAFSKISYLVEASTVISVFHHFLKEEEKK